MPLFRIIFVSMLGSPFEFKISLAEIDFILAIYYFIIYSKKLFFLILAYLRDLNMKAWHLQRLISNPHIPSYYFVLMRPLFPLLQLDHRPCLTSEMQLNVLLPWCPLDIFYPQIYPSDHSKLKSELFLYTLHKHLLFP